VRSSSASASPTTSRSGNGPLSRAVKLKRSETVLFSYIVFKSRADRDRVNAKVMTDPRLAGMMSGKDMPFDGKRMIYGGFQVIVDL
jgi:uncharacterized protein YbaA (DUF1428 family)